MKSTDQLVEQISSWAGVSVHPHRFGGKEFLFGSAEVGHVHTGGVADIPFTRAIRDALLDEKLAEEHHWVPNSGWITFRMRSERDLEHALWLMRLSYMRYQLKTSANANETFEVETKRLDLSQRFRSLLEPFVRKSIKADSAQALSA